MEVRNGGLSTDCAVLEKVILRKIWEGESRAAA